MGSALGCRKVAAARAGVSVEEYVARVESGEKWCTGCKEWHSRAAFGDDASRSDGLAASCLVARKARHAIVYVKRGRRSTRGVFRAATRDGDKRQARARVNHAVDVGQIPDPNSLPCADCGHVYSGQTRHEYDHYLGYSAEHQMSVQAACAPCHRRREIGRASIENRLPVNASLTHEQVRLIRQSEESTGHMATALNVDTETVRRVRKGETYRSIR